jgi:predicted PhzF superfamily epimerase YddE/YHI9
MSAIAATHYRRGRAVTFTRMAVLHVLRVFCSDDRSGGNPLGVFLDGGAIADARRQAVACDLGFSETVFVDEAATGRIQILTPAVELPFAGHPCVGTAWLLAERGSAVRALRPPAGEVRVRYEDGTCFCSWRPEWSPAFEWLELDSPADVDALAGPPPGHDLPARWAWVDEDAGIVRARVFAVGVGIEEDEATGSAAGLLAAQLGRPLDIRQGRGSLIHAQPVGDGLVEIGGRSVLDDVREY